MQPDRSIFREQALKQYMQKQEKEVIPHILSPSIFACLWILFSLILLATILVLRQQVPRFINSSGIILNQREANMGTGDDMVILAFLPANNITQFHLGQRTIVQSGSRGPAFTGTIQYIGSSLVSPSDIQRRYIQNHHVPLHIIQPSLIAEVKPARQLSLPSSY